MRWATGWLGWSFEEAWHTDINAIRVAMEGRADMLMSIFGGKQDSDQDDRPVADKLKSFVKSHNALWTKRRGR